MCAQLATLSRQAEKTLTQDLDAKYAALEAQLKAVQKKVRKGERFEICRASKEGLFVVYGLTR